MSDDSTKAAVVPVEHFDPTAPPKSRRGGRLWYVVGSLLIVVIIYFITQFGSAAIVAGGAALYGMRGSQIDHFLNTSVNGQFLLILLSEATVIACVWWLLRRNKQKLRSIGLISPRFSDIGLALLGVAAFYGLVIIISSVVLKLIPEIDTNQSQQLGFNDVSTSYQQLLTFISLVILPPLGEEVLMRGYLFTRLRKRLSFWPTAVFVSLLFGIAHLQLGFGAPPLWTAALDTTILSFVLVYLRERSGSLWPGIMVHASNNMIAYAIHFHSGMF